MCRRAFVSDSCNRGTAGKLWLLTPLTPSSSREQMNTYSTSCYCPLFQRLFMDESVSDWARVCLSVCLFVCSSLSLSLSLSRCERRTFYTTTLRRYDLDWKADLWKRLLSTRHSPVTQFKPHTITVDNIYNVFQQIRCGLPIRSALTMMKCFSFSSSISVSICLSVCLSLFLPSFPSFFLVSFLFSTIGSH